MRWIACLEPSNYSCMLLVAGVRILCLYCVLQVLVVTTVNLILSVVLQVTIRDIVICKKCWIHELCSLNYGHKSSLSKFLYWEQKMRNAFLDDEESHPHDSMCTAVLYIVCHPTFYNKWGANKCTSPQSWLYIVWRIPLQFPFALGTYNYFSF